MFEVVKNLVKNRVNSKAVVSLIYTFKPVKRTTLKWKSRLWRIFILTWENSSYQFCLKSGFPNEVSTPILRSRQTHILIGKPLLHLSVWACFNFKNRFQFNQEIPALYCGFGLCRCELVSFFACELYFSLFGFFI